MFGNKEICDWGVEDDLFFRSRTLGIDVVDGVAVLGDDEQATGAPDDDDDDDAIAPALVAVVDEGKIILETLRIFGFALRGPRSCCTAKGSIQTITTFLRARLVCFTIFIHIH